MRRSGVGEVGVLKTVGECMIANPPVVAPSDSVAQAAELMDRHGVECVPVTSDGRVVGLLTLRELRLAHPDLRVADGMCRTFATISAQASLWEAEAVCREHGSDYLAVVEGGRLVGLLSCRRVEVELARYVCPLTELPRGELLKRRAEELIAEGREIAVVFIDLDDFGAVNKDHGHVVGDRVLQTIVEALRRELDGDRDILGRYAGDEFVVITTRSVEEARALGNRLARALREVSCPEGVKVSASIGVAGGRRHGSRRAGKPGWTVDDLINLASLASTQAKRRMQPVVVHDSASALTG